MDARKVTTAKPKITGAIYTAPLGSMLPKDAESTLDTVFQSIGYISEDGVTNTNTPESETVKAWGGDIVLSMQNGRPDLFKFKLIEALNENVLKVVYGDANVSGTLEDGISVCVNNNEAESFCWIIESILKGGILKRIVIPSGKMTSVGDISYIDNQPISYEITLTLEPDERGNTHYEYIKKTSARHSEEDIVEEEDTGEEVPDEMEGEV